MFTQRTISAQTQGRKAESIQPWLLARARSRSLSSLRPNFAPLRLYGTLLFVVVIACLLSSFPAGAQEPADTIRVDTRVVFLDALVKDKKTGIPISDLKIENFQVFDDGKPRSISYFTREGQARKPLALVIILDCREDGAGRFLKRPEILKAMTDELAKLPPEDEVAVMAMNIGEDERRAWLTEFTHDSSKLTAALARVPAFVEHPEQFENGNFFSDELNAKAQKPEPKAGVTVNTGDANTAATPQASPTPDDVVETEVIKGKNGATVVRTMKKDGSVSAKRTSSSGKVVVEFDEFYDMAAAVRDSARYSRRLRPASQTAVVWVSDGIAPIFFEDRDATEQILIRENIIFNSLTVDLRTLFKFLMPIGKPVAGWMGISLYGSAKHLAQRSGGEAVRVNRVSDYGSGLSKVIGNLTARYSLGFSLSEEEKDDGRLHALEVKVKAEDAKGKTRKLNVSSRQGYYIPTPGKEVTTATRSN
ncbi:MAG TPA: VWA domain-containing protein [Pyrinomonadaceae bacterium]|nr:VWA domain-containing protein [Pyrinomonadaceae bacterium]